MHVLSLLNGGRFVSDGAECPVIHSYEGGYKCEAE